jgi:hypothetical protein
MADDERDEPSLELPSFGLGRRRARKDRSLEHDPLTAPLEQVEPAEQEKPAPAAQAQVEVEEEVEPPAPEPAPENAPETVPVPAARPLFVEETAAPAPTSAAPAGEAPQEPGGAREAPRGARQPRPTRQPRPARRERPTRPPGSPGGYAAALATGLLVGALTVVLTWLGQRGCEAARDTSSCGEPGLLVLLAILVVMALVGATALRLARVGDSGSTSVLAVGLLTVLVLLFLGGSLFEWWVVLVVPVLSMLTFALSHWVTTSFAGEDGGAS